MSGTVAPVDPSLTDAVGRVHRPAPGARIVSLVPSITELLFDLGLDAQIVGRTAFCVHPKGRVRRARSVGGTKTINLEKLKALAPTHVIVNVDETPRELAERIAHLGITVVVTHPIEVTDNLALFRLMGRLFDRQAEAERLCHDLTAAETALRHAAMSRPPSPVLYLIWKAPWMTVSRETYISRMLAVGGWQTWPDTTRDHAGVRYPIIEVDDAVLSRVERVLFATEPFPFTSSHVEAFAEAHPQHRAKAHLIDGQMISWYGSRAVKGLTYLKGLITRGT